MILMMVVTAVLLGALMLHRFCTFNYLLRYVRLKMCRSLLPETRRVSAGHHLRVVVGLTSIPSRMHGIFPALNSLLLQSITPDRIYLHLPEWSRREGTHYVLPEALTRDKRVFVYRTEDDEGPVMKLLPILRLEHDPRTLIVTVDDDVVYPSDMIETLLHYHRKLPEAALGFMAWDIPRSRRYLDFRTCFANQVSKPTEKDILMGTAGVLYLRGHFQEDFFSDELPEEAFFVDDLRIGLYLASRGVKRYLLPHQLREPFPSRLLTSRTNPLWKLNRDGRNNQVLLEYLFQTEDSHGRHAIRENPEHAAASPDFTPR